MTLSLGQSFFTPESPSGGVPRHLWIVVSDPQRAEVVAIVNLSTTPSLGSGPSDPPCIVRPPEHPSISQDSLVRCDQARVIPPTQLERLLRAGMLSPTRPAPPALVTKLQLVLGASRETPTEVKALLQAQGYLPA